MQSGTINDITNLKFYTDNGLEIPMQCIYTLSWELVSGSFASQYLQEGISGYFIGDIDIQDLSDIKIIPDTLMAGIVNGGKAMVRFASTPGTDKNGMPIFAYGDTVTDVDYFGYIKKVVLNPQNKITVSINANGNTYTNTYKVNDLFEMAGSIYQYTDYYNVNTIYTGNNLADDYEYYQVISLNQLDLVDGQEKPYILEVFEKVLPNVGNFFPFVTYEGSYHQERISEGFIAADTLMVLEENKDEDGNIYYARPYITPDSEYYLLFKPTHAGELKMVKKDITYDIEYVDDISFDLSYIDTESTSVDPLYFTVAFQGDEEGAYQNYLGMYMKLKDNPDKLFYMGIISIKTEVEGEDERFRTLLTNFGVPDPVYYSNIFAEQDYAEQGKDYELINRKSKQLMLTYDSIFNYIGTYKALMNAVKFLGYYDLIFKEWYTLKTSNDTNVDIAVQVIDTSTGSFLKQKLADYGISIEDFRNYNKINKLSMIYHINQEDDTLELCDVKQVYYDSTSGMILNVSTGSYQIPSGVPLTKPTYIYRNDEILTKLMAVKKWLERHVIGVGAYIADITGEGLYFGWQKTQGYQTQHMLEDFSAEQYYTPDVKKVSEFRNSHADITCTLNELNNAVRFEDYKDTKISEFIRYKKNFTLNTVNQVTSDISTLVVSNTIETPVLGDEYEFDLVLKTGTGTLYEWTDASANQILFDEGEIKLLSEDNAESVIKYDDLPYIILENANIHTVYGNWRSNVQWMVREVIDLSTGNTMYKLKNYKTSHDDSYAHYNTQYYILEKADASAYVKYTENTNYGLPMFMIYGYRFMNADIANEQASNFKLESGTYILEILKGDMLFKQQDGCSVKVKFDDSAVQKSRYATGLFDKEQKIELEYTYPSKRLPFVKYDESAILQDVSTTMNYINTVNQFVTANINKLQQYYDTIANDILSFSGQTTQNGTAYKEAVDYITDILNNEYAYLSQVKAPNMEKSLLYDKCVNSFNTHYDAFKSIDVNVSRIGQYELISRAYDRYNNVYVAKYDNTINVTAQPVKIDTYVYNSNSNNYDYFYRFNKNGDLLDASDMQTLISQSDAKPEFPSNYQIIDFDNSYTSNSVKFDNMSYCIDTPKNNDYVIFENAVEKCVKAKKTTNGLILYMLDENPNRNGLYNSMSDKVNIVIYDKMKMEDASVISCGMQTDRYYQDPQTDTDVTANSYIKVYLDTADTVMNLINDVSHYKTYVLNTTEYDSSMFDIVIDYENKTTTFTDKFNTSHNYPVFNPEDVVKLRYYRNYQIDGSAYKTISETAYRITSVYMVNTDKTETDMSFIDFSKYDKTNIVKYKYVINGLANAMMLGDASIDCVMTYANHYPVHYMTKVSGDGLEYNVNLGYDNYHILQDEFIYNGKHMNIGKYIDDTYGGRIMDYDMDNLKNTWLDISTALSDVQNIDIYKYNEFPVSVSLGKPAIFKHIDSENILQKDYHAEWKVNTYMIDDTENWDNYRNNSVKKTLFRSVNGIIAFKTEILGPYDIQLICIDWYGNKVINEGSGLLYVDNQ